jgi:hypothetical protein
VTTWVGIALALVVACAAWLRARTLARRLDQMTKLYWELRYQHGELRAQVARLDPGAEPRQPAPAPEPPPQTFIPLSSLKR